MVFGQKAEACDQEGVGDLVDFGGYTPPRCRQEGELFLPLFRRGPLAPVLRPENGVRARHLPRLSCQRVIIEFQAVWGKRGHVRSVGVLPFTRKMTEKPGGIPPFE